MPGSWNQIGRSLIADIRETWRIHRGQIACYSVSPAMGCTPVYFDPALTCLDFGGVIDPPLPALLRPIIRLTAAVRAILLKIEAAVAGDNLCMEYLEAKILPLLPVEVALPQALPLFLDSAALTLPPQPIAVPRPQIIGRSELRLTRLEKATRLSAARLRPPQIRNGFARLKPETRLFPIHQKAFPVERKSVPPYRFSKAARALFRERLASRASLSEHDVQIVHVFDRIYLGLFQSISQSPDGTLSCLPKIGADLRDAVTRSQVPVYLVVGKSIQQPDKPIQVVLPMSELNNDEDTP